VLKGETSNLGRGGGRFWGLRPGTAKGLGQGGGSEQLLVSGLLPDTPLPHATAFISSCPALMEHSPTRLPAQGFLCQQPQKRQAGGLLKHHASSQPKLRDLPCRRTGPGGVAHPFHPQPSITAASPHHSSHQERLCPSDFSCPRRGDDHSRAGQTQIPGMSSNHLGKWPRAEILPAANPMTPLPHPETTGGWSWVLVPALCEDHSQATPSLHQGLSPSTVSRWQLDGGQRARGTTHTGLPPPVSRNQGLIAKLTGQALSC